MSITVTVLLVGFLMLMSAGLVSLILAWRNAVDGYEDETGFHRIEPAPADGLSAAEAAAAKSGDSAQPFAATAHHGTLGH